MSSNGPESNGGNGQHSHEAMMAERTQQPTLITEEEKLEAWQGLDHFRKRLESLHQLIELHESNARRLSEKLDDIRGSAPDEQVNRLEEEEAQEQLEAKRLRLERIDLIERVPRQFYQESLPIREELGWTIPSNPEHHHNA